MRDIVDDVALERAARGDRGVWASLTPTERRLAMVAAYERRLDEVAAGAVWGEVTRSPEWLAGVVSAAGYRTAETFMKAARRMSREA